MAENVNFDFNTFNTYDVFIKPTSHVIYNQKSRLNSDYLNKRFNTFLSNIFTSNKCRRGR